MPAVTDTLLALIPVYGILLIGGSVILSCMALPLPSSMLVMAGGSFAASGDLLFWQVALVAWAGFVVGDQLTYQLARKAGAPILGRLRKGESRAKLIGRAEDLLEERGAVAVFLSRTILSPLGPYVTYISGALGVRWAAFSAASVLGAALWAVAYSGLGYAFADQLTQVAAAISNGLGFVAAFAVAGGGLFWMARKLRHAREAGELE